MAVMHVMVMESGAEHTLLVLAGKFARTASQARYQLRLVN